MSSSIDAMALSACAAVSRCRSITRLRSSCFLGRSVKLRRFSNKGFTTRVSSSCHVLVSSSIPKISRLVLPIAICSKLLVSVSSSSVVALTLACNSGFSLSRCSDFSSALSCLLFPSIARLSSSSETALATFWSNYSVSSGEVSGSESSWVSVCACCAGTTKEKENKSVKNAKRTTGFSGDVVRNRFCIFTFRKLRCELALV